MSQAANRNRVVLPPWLGVVVGAFSIAGAGLIVGAVSDSASSADEEEVCTATVYEGCPQRWDYLLTSD